MKLPPLLTCNYRRDTFIVGLWRRFTGSATGFAVPSGNCSDGRKIWIAHERAGSTQRATNHS
jgi:hypothetical protein